MALAETRDQIRERIWNPLPEITHCPCGHHLKECLRITVSGEECRILDTYYSEFLETVPDRFLLIAGIVLCEAAALCSESANSEPWD